MEKVTVVRFTFDEHENSVWIRKYLLAPIVAVAKIKHGNEEVKKDFNFQWRGNEKTGEFEKSVLTIFLDSEISKEIASRFNDVLLKKGIEDKYQVLFGMFALMTGTEYLGI